MANREQGSGRAGRRGGAACRASRPACEDLEGRPLMAAALAPIPAVSVPTTLGYQVPLDGSAAGVDQAFTVTSSNPLVSATVAQGNFVTLNVSHASSGPNDPAFGGAITIDMFGDLTPLTVSRIEELVQQGFYNGKNFHRVANNFPGPTDYIVQGGSVNGDGTGTPNVPGFPFQDEFVQQLAFTGTYQVAMANAGRDTNTSQFFFTTGQPASLNYQYTIFGQVVAGQNIIQEMTKVATNNTTPVSPILINSATISATNPDGVIHVNAADAPAGTTSTITVTAHAADGTTATQSFQVTVQPNVDSSGNPINERAFLPAFTQQQLNPTVGLNQPYVFQIPGMDAEAGDTLTYTVQGGTSTNPSTGAVTFTPLTNATSTIDQATGIVTVTPNAGFTGTIPVLMGVRDQVNHGASGTSLDSPSNYDWHVVNLNVTSGAQVNLQPIAVAGKATAVVGQPTTVQLAGNTANPNSGQTLTYSLVSQPTQGTITNFNPATGTLTYTPNATFSGTDSFQFNVTDVGAPTPNLTSTPATETITVAAVPTGAVRVIGAVLVVDPVPRTDKGTNTIDVTQSNGNIQVTVNGLLDINQPAVSSIDRIVVYGSKANDNVTIDPSLTMPATISGGQGGTNILKAGGGPTRIHAWFGRNTITGSPQTDAIIGARGHMKIKPTAGNDLIYEGVVVHQPTFNDFYNNAFPNGPRSKHQARGNLPVGQYYKFVKNRLVPIGVPRLTRGANLNGLQNQNLS